MRNSWIIALRELKERVLNPAFLWMLFIGPLLFLSCLYFLFKAGDEGKTSLKVLIADPTGMMENKIVSQETKAVEYYFFDDYLELEEFRDNKKYQKFDALIEVNEKILINKKAFVFYREAPSLDVKMQLKFQLERRVEEVMIAEFTNMEVDDFRQIKQALNVDFRNVYDPKNEASNLEGWVGFIFGLLIILFVFLFGLTVLRSTAREKSNRIVEVLLASVKPTHLMLGKICGIGLAALIQILVWSLFITLGLLFFRATIFPDLLDFSNYEGVQMSSEVKEQLLSNIPSQRYNEFIDLVYKRIDFTFFLFHFFLFFIATYFFYAAFFSAIGAMSGSESDGQQFLIPLLCILGLSVYSGYYAIYFPDAELTSWLQFIPFTSSVIVMVKLAQGYPEGTYYLVWLSLLTLILFTVLFLSIAGRIYRNGILHFGLKASLRNLFYFMRK